MALNTVNGMVSFEARIHVKNNCVKENVLLLPDLTLTTEKLFS